MIHKRTAAVRPALVGTVAIAAGLLLAVAGEGPDFGHYADWAAAALSGDIFELRGNVLSPAGVPFDLAAAGPGLLFAVGKAVLLPLTLGSAAILTGWIATLVFWLSAFTVLRRLARDNESLAWLGAGALFVGTHAGLYSHSYATEAFANALIAALWALMLTRERWRPLDSLAVGALAGLLLLVRAHVVLYAIPALWLAVFGEAHRGRPEGRPLRPDVQGRPLRSIAVRFVATAVPLVIALTQYALVNRWMTGEPLHPPYVYGGNGFTSVDLRHPEVLAVLTHPWHGLLSYHPLYFVSFVAVVVETLRAKQWRALWAVTLAAAVAHVWVQAGWYIWWLGGSTFGLRGMAPAALPLVAGLVSTIRRDADVSPRRASLWIVATAVCCAWSYPLLLRGNTQFYSWAPLLDVQTPAIAAIAVILAAWALMFALRPPVTTGDVERECRLVAIGLVGATFGYLAWQVSLRAGSGTLALKGVIGAAVAGAAVLVWGRFRSSDQGTAGESPAGAGRHGKTNHALLLAALALFAVQAVLFGRLAIRTERHIASGSPPPRTFDYVSASPVDELRVTYAEYLEVQGFETRKAAFRRFLAWQRVDASTMSPTDRQIADAVRQRIDREPRFGDLLVEATTRDGVVEITGKDMSQAQQSLARELAQAVPGTVSVTVTAN